MRKDLLIIFILFLFILPGFVFAQYIDDFNEDDYDLGALDGQQSWETLMPSALDLYVQNYAGNRMIGPTNVDDVHGNKKQYFDNSTEGHMKVWFYINSSPKANYHTVFHLKNENGSTCASVILRYYHDGSFAYRQWLWGSNGSYVSPGGLQNVYTTVQWGFGKLQYFTIDWNEDHGGLKFQYHFNSGSVGSTTSGWLLPMDSSCQYAGNGVKDFYFEQVADGTDSYKTYIHQIEWQGTDLVAPDGSSTSLKTRVKSLDGWTCQYSTSTEKWSIRALSRIIHEYQYDPQTDAIMELYDSNNNKLDEKSYSIRRDSGSGFFTQVFIENSFMREEFVRDYWFRNASSSGSTSTTYVLKATFENQDHSTTSTVEQYFTINCDIDKYDSGGYLTMEDLTDYYSSQTFTTEEFYDKWGFQAQLQKAYDRIKSIFPFSWVIAVKEIWTDAEESSYTSGDAFTLTFNLGTSSAAGFLQNKDLKVVDFHEAKEQYGTYITNFRTILNYIIWISVVFVILRKVKGFFLSLNPSSTNT